MSAESASISRGWQHVQPDGTDDAADYRSHVATISSRPNARRSGQPARRRSTVDSTLGRVR